jgi:hypothetical protein
MVWKRTGAADPRSLKGLLEGGPAARKIFWRQGKQASNLAPEFIPPHALEEPTWSLQSVAQQAPGNT